MSNPKVTAKAVVTVTLEISPADTWGEDCAVSQVRSQAKEAALGMLHRAIRDTPGFRLAGVPKVTVISMPPEEPST